MISRVLAVFYLRMAGSCKDLCFLIIFYRFVLCTLYVIVQNLKQVLKKVSSGIYYVFLNSVFAYLASINHTANYINCFLILCVLDALAFVAEQARETASPRANS